MGLVGGIGLSPEWWIVLLAGLALAATACVSVARNTGLGGSAKALWFLIVLVFPILGPAIYFGVRNDW